MGQLEQREEAEVTEERGRQRNQAPREEGGSSPQAQAVLQRGEMFSLESHGGRCRDPGKTDGRDMR